MSKKTINKHPLLSSLACCALLLSTSCGRQKVVKVEVVDVSEAYTLIEDEDGFRYRCMGVLGEEGDTFNMKRKERGIIVGSKYTSY